MNETLITPPLSYDIILIIPEFLQKDYSKVVSVTDVYTQTLYGNVKVHASNVYRNSSTDTRFEPYTVFNEYDNNAVNGCWQTSFNPTTTTFEIEMLDKSQYVLVYYDIDKVYYQNDGRYYKNWKITSHNDKIIDEHNDGSLNNPKYNELTRFYVQHQIPTYKWTFTFSNITRSLGINRLRLYGYKV